LEYLDSVPVEIGHEDIARLVDRDALSTYELSVSVSLRNIFFKEFAIFREYHESDAVMAGRPKIVIRVK